MANRFVFVVNALSGPELRGGRCDADQIHSLLCSPNIGACRTKGTSLLQDCASRSVFNNALLRVLKEWKPQDQFIFYFTGHGEIKHGTYTLIFGEGGGRTNLPFSNIMADLQAHGVSRAIIVIDACHSGAALKRGEKRLPRLDPPEIRELPRGLVVLTSCRETESSYEKEDGSSSIFTHLFCKGIRSGLGGKATPDGFIGPDDIITYINEQLETEGFSSYPQSPAFCVDNANRQVWIAKNHTKIIQQDNEQKNEEQSTRSLEELKLLYEQTEASRRPCPGPSVDDLDLSVIKTYAEFINKADLLQKKSLNEIAQNLGLFSPITNNDLHQAAVLCFVKEPHLFIPQARALFTVGDKRSNDFRRVDVHGPLSTQVTQLFELTRREIMRSIGSY
ncbi:MAG: caspase family protein, partial [Candidatus Pacebacteria bacterium]|nr:caspase family protein [Candidatus Paceibacterota bacterium]